jgi:putative tricarboxylic transport membrane protein
MKISSVKKRNGYIVIGVGGFLFAAGYLVMSLELPFGQMDQPGAAVFPVIVSAIMMLACLLTLQEAWRMSKTLEVGLPVGTDRTRLSTMMGLLLGYIVLLPWLGQLVCSIVFFVVMLRSLSDLGWFRIAVYSLALSLALYVAFIVVLKVPMPRGELFYLFY